MFVIVWTYEVPADRRAGFEAAYGPNGSWAQLFARAPGFGGVELLHDDDALDAQCAALTTSEHKWGCSSRRNRYALGEPPLKRAHHSDVIAERDIQASACHDNMRLNLCGSCAAPCRSAIAVAA
jgi:hypothetical protein